MKMVGWLACLGLTVLILAACGADVEQAPAPITTVATDTPAPLVVSVVVSATPAAGQEAPPATKATGLAEEAEPSPTGADSQEPEEHAAGATAQPSTPGAPRLQSSEEWTSSHGGNAAGSRYNPTILSLPLQLQWVWDDGGRSGAGALAITGRRLFVASTRGQMQILDPETGGELGATSLWSEGGSLSNVVVTGDSVIACTAYWAGGRQPEYPARVTGLDLEGHRLWGLDLPGEQGPCYLVADAGLVAVAPAGSGSEANWLGVYDARTGEERWRTTLPEGRRFRPLASDGTLLYVAQPIGEGGGLVAYELASGEVRWEQGAEPVWNAQYGAAQEGRLYVLTGYGPLIALDGATGQELWETSFEDADAGSGLALGQDQVYVARSGKRGLYALDAATGTPRWQALEGRWINYLLASRSHLLVASEGAEPNVAELLLLDAATGGIQGQLLVPGWERRELGGGLAVADGRIYAACWDGLRAYGTGESGRLAPSARPQLTAITPSPTATKLVSPLPTPTAASPLSGRYARVWTLLGGAGGRLGQPLDRAMEGVFAEQHFERGLMHWGRPDATGEPEVQVIVYGEESNRRAGSLWGRYTDYWQEGMDEYSCAEAVPTLGPRRGFGLVWCQYVRGSVGAPLEAEYEVQGGYQDFQGGTMLWSPRDSGIYVLFNHGDWQFETSE